MARDRSEDAVNTDTITDSDDATSVLTIEVQELDGRTCVTLAGELDGVSVPPLQDRLATLAHAQLAGDLVLDIAGVTFLDSTALTLFVLLDKRLVAPDHHLTLLHPSPMARRVFAITGLDKVLSVEPSDL